MPDDVAPIQGDPHQLRQLFTNLLTNAFEAINGRGAVRIDATVLPEDEPTIGGEALGPMVQVDVIDDGPGMPADVMDQIFSPFFTTKPQGTGLGLAIVRKIVNAHDGRIDVNAPPGRRHAVPGDAAGVEQSRAVSIRRGRRVFAFGVGWVVRGGRVNGWFRQERLSNGPDSGGRRSRFAAARHRPRAVRRASRSR